MKEKQNYVTFKYIYVDIAKDVETRFDVPNYELETPLSKEKNKNDWINER